MQQASGLVRPLHPTVATPPPRSRTTTLLLQKHSSSFAAPGHSRPRVYILHSRVSSFLSTMHARLVIALVESLAFQGITYSVIETSTAEHDAPNRSDDANDLYNCLLAAIQPHDWLFIPGVTHAKDSTIRSLTRWLEEDDSRSERTISLSESSGYGAAPLFSLDPNGALRTTESNTAVNTTAAGASTEESNYRSATGSSRLYKCEYSIQTITMARLRS